LDPDPYSLISFFIAINSAFALKIALLLILLVCSALISGAEVAFFSLSPTDINELEEKKTAKGGVVIRLLKKPKKLLATILITNNAINIGAILLFNVIGDVLFTDVNYYSFGFY